MKEFKEYTVRKTIRLTQCVVAQSARQAAERASQSSDSFAKVTTSGWWCRKDRKGGIK